MSLSNGNAAATDTGSLSGTASAASQGGTTILRLSKLLRLLLRVAQPASERHRDWQSLPLAVTVLLTEIVLAASFKLAVY